ncbi:MAG: PTS sugar transporter subunit IIA [Planctomycetes bacterium]|nr:PTS sugar transporter subunit IIA [Planctomycetota bacterium]
MKITEVLERECVCYPLQATDKTGVIAELVDVLHAKDHFTDRDVVLKAVLARERTRSTGIGLGLGVPHGKTAACKELVMALGVPAMPIEFDSADGRPCRFIVLLVSPIDKTGPHIQALANVSRLWQTDGFREALAKAESADDIYDAIARHEA